jgi:hypothetical protein
MLSRYQWPTGQTDVFMSSRGVAVVVTTRSAEQEAKIDEPEKIHDEEEKKSHRPSTIDHESTNYLHTNRPTVFSCCQKENGRNGTSFTRSALPRQTASTMGST